MSQASWVTIAMVAKAGASLSQIELANRVGIEPASMVTTIDRLVKAQLLVREPSTDDRRVKLIKLTPMGVELYEKVKTEADKLRKELLMHIDEKQLLATAELLEHLQNVAESIDQISQIN
jgi:MarR family transcriptional regulator for hemolysin